MDYVYWLDSIYQYIINTTLGYHIKQIQSDNQHFYFKETSKEKPRLVIYHRVFKDKQFQKHFPWVHEMAGTGGPNEDLRYQFVIPKNSVVKGYRIE